MSQVKKPTIAQQEYAKPCQEEEQVSHRPFTASQYLLVISYFIKMKTMSSERRVEKEKGHKAFGILLCLSQLGSLCNKKN